MSSSFYIALDQEVDFDTFIHGNAFADELDTINSLAEENRMKTADAYLGMPSGFDMSDSYDDDDGWDDDRDDDQDLDETWFEPSDGLAWIAEIRELVEENESRFDHPEQVIEDLNDMFEILKKAKKAKAQWHFEIEL